VDSLILPSSLLISGIFSLILSYNSIFRLLVAIEIILLSISLNFLIFSIIFFNPLGQLYALLILVLAAAESVVGLTLLILLSNITGGSSLNGLVSFKG
jgi:NADH-quinone oxidoreductase subunit K